MGRFTKWVQRHTQPTVVDRTPVQANTAGTAAKTAATGWVLSGIAAGEGLVPSEETVVARAIFTAMPFIVAEAAIKGAEAGSRQVEASLEQRLRD